MLYMHYVLGPRHTVIITVKSVSGEYLVRKVFFFSQNMFCTPVGERSGSVSRPRGYKFEPHRRHCVVSLSKTLILAVYI